MLNKLTKRLLVATSITPALLIMIVGQLFTNGWNSFVVQLIVVSVSLVTVAICVIRYIRRHGERTTLSICKAKNSDKEVLTFLLAYLLPVLTKHEYLFKAFNVPTLTMLLLVSIAIYHSSAFDFNPLLGLLGYHFYEVEGDDNFPYLLISAKPIRKPSQNLLVVQLCDYTFLHVEE